MRGIARFRKNCCECLSRHRMSRPSARKKAAFWSARPHVIAVCRRVPCPHKLPTSSSSRHSGSTIVPCAAPHSTTSLPASPTSPPSHFDTASSKPAYSHLSTPSTTMAAAFGAEPTACGHAAAGGLSHACAQTQTILASTTTSTRRSSRESSKRTSRACLALALPLPPCLPRCRRDDWWANSTRCSCLHDSLLPVRGWAGRGPQHVPVPWRVPELANHRCGTRRRRCVACASWHRDLRPPPLPLHGRVRALSQACP